MQAIKNLVPLHARKLVFVLLLTLLYPINFGLTSPAEAAYQTGSASFTADGQYLSVPNDSDFNVGTDDFTIEWWQNMNNPPTTGQIYSWPRAWVIRSYTYGDFGLSIEPNGDNPQVYIWLNGATLVGTLSGFSTNYQNQWTHFAITRTSNTVRVFVNGSKLGDDIPTLLNYNDTTTDLSIGSQAGAAGTTFPGQITNFNFVKGTSLYSSNFAKPTTPTSPNTNTKLLLLHKNSSSLLTDSSSRSKIVTNIGSVTYSSSAPSWAVDSIVPTLSSANLANDGLSVDLTFSEELSDLTAVPANFSVTLNGAENKSISSLTRTGSSISLKFSTAVAANTSINFSYTDPSGSDDTNALQDNYGNDVASISNFVVTNRLDSDFDSALSLNGSNQYASASGAQVIPTATASTFTAEAWIRQPASRTSGPLYQILSQGTGTNVFYLKLYDGTVRFGRNGYTDENICNVGVPADVWTHVAVVVGTTSQSCYINGYSAGTFTQSSATAIATSFAVGQYVPNGAENFLGQIDEVKIWNVARTADQIKSDLKTYGGSLTDGLVAYYNFNELVGNKVFNRSSGGSSDFDLTTANSPTITSNSIIESSSFQAYTVVKFLRTFLVAGGGWKSPSTNKQMNYLVVGGGGAGGGGIGGGGGAGEYVESSTLVTSSTVIPVVVGVGGTPRSRTAGNAGQNSSFSETITANGGGGGGTDAGGGPTQSQGPNLGSQGGGGFSNTLYTGSQPRFEIASASDSNRFRNNGGAGSGGGGVTATAGGGGGAGSAGSAGSTATQSGGNGGNGKVSTITGENVTYAGGGGGGVNGDTGALSSGSAGNGGSGGGGKGGLRNNEEVTASCYKEAAWNGCGGSAGLVNTGSGGGGGSNAGFGGSGGSGIVIIRYITIAQIILTQPLSDTTTVGTVDTFTISTSVAPVPLTKSVQWQFTADTTTGTTGWTNVSSGTGSTTDTFTTAALTKAMNKYRYRAIVTFSDTATSSVVETSTAVILTINDSITITSDTSTITRKYGSTQTPPRTISYSGGTTESGTVGTSTSHTVRGAYGTLASGKIVLDTTTSTVVFRVDTGTVVGTYIETITVTDFKGATATYTQKVVVTQADTLTVQADTLTAITYNPAGMTINPTVTITGLVASDTATLTTIKYSAPGSNCANGGTCSTGDTGPGGGKVFYVSGNTYYEAAPKTWYSTFSYNGSTYNNANTVYCANGSNTKIDPYNPPSNTSSTGWGGGKTNTDSFKDYCAMGAIGLIKSYAGGGKSDWYIPNATEMSGLVTYWSNNSGLLTQFDTTTSVSFWTSDASYDATWGWLLTQPYFNGSGTWFTAGAAFNHQGGKILPIRSFTVDGSVQPALIATVTKPTNAGTYTITPSALVLANNVDTSNYVSVIYRTSTFTINKARQDTLTVSSILGIYETGTATMKITTLGGTDTGTVTYAIVSGGGASGCSVSSNILTVTSAGTCKLTATKAATLNYLIAYSDTATVTFTRFVSRPIQVQLYPTMIPLNGGNSLETTTATVPSVTSVTATGAGAFTITGSGFTGVNRVVIGGTAVTFSFSTDSSINVTGAAGLTGPLIIECSDGRMGPVPFWLIL